MENELNEYQQIINKLYKIYVDKNHDYGNSFDDTCDEFGLIAPVIRMNDKIKRCKSCGSLIKNDAKNRQYCLDCGVLRRLETKRNWWKNNN